MPRIPELPSARLTDLTSGSTLPIYINDEGTPFKLALSTLVSYFQANFTRTDYTTDRKTPANGDTITITQDGQNYWMLLKPTGALTTLTLVLPATTVASDGQEILVTITNQVTTFTINANGGTVNGGPSTLGADDSFRLKYNTLEASWFEVT